jgi:hypothetical protein
MTLRPSLAGTARTLGWALAAMAVVALGIALDEPEPAAPGPEAQPATSLPFASGLDGPATRPTATEGAP